MLNPYQQYKNASVNTMTKGELLMLLLDESVKKVTLSKILMEKKDYEQAAVNIGKCRKIFNHLTVTLDEKYALSRELIELYQFINKELIRAEAMKSAQIIDDILPIIKDMRDTWAEADRLSRIKG